MALYFFHLRNRSDHIIDDAGQDLDSLAAAREAAIREARAIVAADALLGFIDLCQSIEIEDTVGKIVCLVPLAEAVIVKS